MRIVFMGTPDFAVQTLNALLSSSHEVVAVYTQPDKKQGRKQVLTPPPVKSVALAHGIAVYQPDTLRDTAVQAELAMHQADVIVVVAYGKILPKEILELPPKGCINVHGSLLPRWRGAAPIQWAVIAGDKKTGVTTMQMAQGLDTGDMLLKYETEIGARETAGKLFDRLAKSGAELLIQTLSSLDSITPEPQDESQSTYASMLSREIAVLDWSKTASEIDNMVRGLNPWPVALTTLSGAPLKIYEVLPCDGKGRAGEVLHSSPKAGLVVACGEGAVRILSLQPSGKKRMDAEVFLLGRAIVEGTILGE